MRPMDARLAPTASAIAFDRIKYGRRLLVDACRIGAIPGFIRTPVPHRLRFHEIALVTSGRGALELDGVGVEVGASRLCITAPGEVRRWRLDDPARLDGWLVFFEAGLLDEFFADASFVSTLPVLGGPAAGRSLALDAKRFDALAAIADAMH